MESIFKLLKTQSADTSLNHDTREGAKYLIFQINLKFICLLNFWNDVLCQIDHVNILLQSKNQTIDVACNMINGLIRSMEDIRKNGFNNSLDKAKNMAECLNISSEFKDKRKRKISRKDLCEADNEGIVTDENSLRIQCYQSLDSILTSLCWRFEKMSEIIADFNFLTRNSLKVIPSKEIKRCVNDLALKYENDIDGPELIL